MSSRARLDVSRHGTLAIRFYWRGRPVWEGTGEPDTPANRAHFQKLCDQITDELGRGAFDDRRYLHFFPQGNRAADMAPSPSTAAMPALRDYAAEWLARQEREGRRRGTVETYRGHLDYYLLDRRLPDGVVFGNLRLDEITRRRLIQLRAELLGQVSVRTARNIMGGGLRGVINAALADELIAVNPFTAMPRWPSAAAIKPDPFEAAERDQLLGWFHGGPYYAFVFTLFHTGMRPSEAIALRHADVDLERATLNISKSRVWGEENAPKTEKSARIITLTPAVVAAIRRVVPLLPDPDGYLFTKAGTQVPIDQKAFSKGEWRRALRGAKLRAIRFYGTRHTFISIAISLGLNMKMIATYCGTSAGIIERHYAKWLAASGGDQLAALVTEADRSQASVSQAPKKVREAR